jgi:hypothetical protein
MTTHIFKTLAEAKAAGYVRASDFPRMHFPACSVGKFRFFCKDTSEPGYFGDSFAIAIRGGFDPSEKEWHLVAIAGNPTFGSTVTVDLTHQLNKMQRVGCSAQMFPPGVVAAGILAAKAVIESWLTNKDMLAEAEQRASLFRVKQP